MKTAPLINSRCMHDMLIGTCSWCLKLPEDIQIRYIPVCGKCGDPLEQRAIAGQQLIRGRWRNVGECCEL